MLPQGKMMMLLQDKVLRLESKGIALSKERSRWEGNGWLSFGKGLERANIPENTLIKFWYLK